MLEAQANRNLLAKEALIGSMRGEVGRGVCGVRGGGGSNLAPCNWRGACTGGQASLAALAL